MDKKKLETWANLLLDTGKRNNLINFKDVKSSSVEVVLPDTDKLFEKVESQAVFEVYDPMIIDDEDLAEETKEAEAIETAEEAETPEVIETSEAADTSETVEISETTEVEKKAGASKEIPDRETYIELYAPRIKKEKQILLYNRWVSPVTALKNIDKKAKTAIEETGVNVAYMAFGFVHWKEKGFSDISYSAPLLLAPVLFKNESAISPYYIRMTEDDVIVNPTFNFKLEAEYGITLPAYEDENLAEYIAKVEEIVGKLSWTVTKECKIGIFSFLKLNMYQDLQENAEQILKNDNVRMLLGESVPTDTPINVASEESEKAEKNLLLTLHNVVDADSSQLEAIQMVKSGKSFVLQGPPGTGKSQTITNIIAECLSDGKKVLFVSEKLAALNVVYDKLKNAGLDEFCLELHSYKANKKSVIDNLCKTLRSPRTGLSERAAAEIEEKRGAQEKLDRYEAELHMERPVIEKSLYGLYNDYAACRNVTDTGAVIRNISEKGRVYLKKAVSLLEQYTEFSAFTGYNYKNNCWYGYTNQDTSYQKMQEVKANMQNAAENLEDLIPVMEKISEKYQISLKSVKGAKAITELFDLIGESSLLSPEILKESSFQTLIEKIKALKEKGDDLLAVRSQIEADYDQDIYKMDAITAQKKLERQYNGMFSRIFSGEYKEIVTAIRLANKKGQKPSYENALNILSQVIACQEKEAIFEAEEAPLKALFGKGYAGENTKWDKLLDDLQSLSRLKGRGLSFGNLPAMDREAYENEKENLRSLSSEIKKVLASCQKEREALDGCFDQKILDLWKLPAKLLVRKLDDCMKGMDGVDYWCKMNNLLGELKNADLISYLDLAIEKNIPARDFAMSYQKSFAYQWIDHIIHQSEDLTTFNRISHDQEVTLFAEKDKTQFAISKTQIRAKLSEMRPSTDMISAGSAVSVLLREGDKKRKQKSIRKLLEETGELVQILKPCFLMSPLSVSTYLGSGDIHFDVVVFDEASQIFPQDAVGAIYRGKQLIVVGDSKQMPPSNFFNTTMDIEGDEETGDITDFESILDLCSTSLPQRRLKWHYRSRFEQLITFSNKNFYDGDLITFPSACTDREGVGVDYYFADGIYEQKKRNNRQEAEFVVDLIFKNIDMYPDRSLGVVAFSIAQQDLIDRLLAKRRQEDPSREFFFNSDTKEPFFIKNLETVQGDERDTIIFSVAYAKNAQGQLKHNFGPLNRVGGERRLNVAVTRAKINVQLVASIHHTDIDLSRTQAEGARLLKEYLDYAENGQVALQRAVKVEAFDQYDSAFEIEVCEFLREKGFTVDTQVGSSSFRIDLAVRKPDTSDYVLAVECDGATYHSAKNARDRDRLRQSVLEGMGWNFYRIWSTDWFKNKSVEKTRLEEAVKKALLEVKTFEKKAEAAPVEVFDEMLDVKHFEFPKYVMANVHELASEKKSFLPFVRAILDVEAPLSEEWLLKRICFVFNRSKVTNVVQEDYKKIMYGCGKYGIKRNDGFLYLEDQTEYMLRVPDGEEKREIKYIAKEELAAGIHEMLKENITADKESLYRAIVKQLGYAKMTEAIYNRMEEALDLIEGIIEKDGTLSLFDEGGQTPENLN